MISTFGKIAVIIIIIITTVACNQPYGNYSAQGSMEVNPESQIEDINSFIEENPKDAEGYYIKSKLTYEASKFTESEISISKALQLDSANTSYRFLFARILAALGQNNQAILQASQVELVDPNQKVIMFLLERYSIIGDLDKAAEYGKKATEMEIATHAVLVPLAKSILATGDTVLALSTLSDIVKNTQNQEAQLLMIDILIGLGNYKQAMILLKKNLGADPNNLEIMKLLGNLYLQQEKPDSALVYYKSALSDQSDTELYLNIAEAMLVKQLFDSAIYYSSIILESDSADLQRLWILGKAYDKKYYYSRASFYFQKTYLIDSTFRNVNQEIIDLNRKIAYLRRIREQQADTITNNN